MPGRARDGGAPGLGSAAKPICGNGEDAVVMIGIDVRRVRDLPQK